jgi:tetratricopeptide (TPR) repeat protein
MMKYFMQSLDALQFMHSHNYVHRDLKPDNIMIDEELEQAKIMDLGLAKQIGEQEPDRKSDLDILLADSGKTGVYNVSPEALKQLGKLSKRTVQTLEGQVMGTPAYMSPDQINDSKGVDQRADIYSMGVILYEILTGEKPHKGETPINTLMNILKEEAVPPIKLKNTLYEIPKELSAICMTALSKDPKYRYRTVKACLDDIQAYIANEPVSVYQDNFWERIAKWGKRNKRKAGMLVGAAMLMPVLIGGIGIVRAIGAQNELSLEKGKTVAERKAKEEAEGRAEAEAKAKKEAVGRADAEAKAKEEAEKAAEAEKGRADLAERLVNVHKDKAEALNLNNDALQMIQYAVNIKNADEKRKVLEEAIQVLEQARKLDGNSAHIYHNFGVIYGLLGDDKQAMSYYNQALTVNPNLGKARFGRGNLKVSTGDLSGAIEDYEKAAETMPLFVTLYSNLAVCYIRKGNLIRQKGLVEEAEQNYHKAIENCDAALRINPQDALTLRNKGESQMYLGEYRNADETLQKAVTHGHIYSRLLLARNMIEAASSGNPLYPDWKERARDHCARAVRIDKRLAEEAKGILEKIR